MEPLLVYPYPVAADLSQALERAGYRYIGVTDEVDAERKEPDDGWGGAARWPENGPGLRPLGLGTAHGGLLCPGDYFSCRLGRSCKQGFATDVSKSVVAADNAFS